jgi:hypothetical protein
MKRTLLFRPLLVCALASPALPAPCPGQTVFREPHGRFTLTLPQGWYSDDGLLAEYRRRNTDSSFTALAVFTHQSRSRVRATALLAVQLGHPPAPESLALAFAHKRGAIGVQYDSARDVVRFGFANPLPEAGTIEELLDQRHDLVERAATRTIAALKLANFGLVGVTLVGAASDSSITKADLDSIVASIEIDPAQRYARLPEGATEAWNKAFAEGIVALALLVMFLRTRFRTRFGRRDGSA